jgi:hypothetical protein
LTPELKKNLDPVLAGVHLIVIGYGGYDTDIKAFALKRWEKISL